MEAILEDQQKKLMPFPPDWEAAHLIALLRAHLPALTEKYSIKSLGIFGSFVRNEQRKGSDLDVLIEFNDPPGLFEYVHLQNELSRLLRVKVDLVMQSGLRPTIGKRILEEVVLV